MYVQKRRKALKYGGHRGLTGLFCMLIPMKKLQILGAMHGPLCPLVPTPMCMCTQLRMCVYVCMCACMLMFVYTCVYVCACMCL